MKVPLLDLAAHHAPIREEIDAAIASVIDSSSFILGKAVADFEAACAAYCRTPHALGVSSGTDALLVALMAAGIEPGDEVVTTPFSFFATAGAIARLGARPVFSDIDPETFDLDPAGLERRITPRTAAIIPVHLFGQCCDMDPILALARSRTPAIPVIEDAAQAIGAELDGRRAGSMGDFGCFSFFPSKNLGALGDGGLVTTTDPDRHSLLAKLRNHGASPKYHHALVGGNFRLDALQAAVLSAKLPHLDFWTGRRQDNAAYYKERLAPLVAAGRIALPVERPGRRHIWNQFTIRVLSDASGPADGKARDRVQSRLKEAGIGSEVYYPVPLHLQECFSGLGYHPGDLPHAERASREVLSIPIYPELEAPLLETVCTALEEALRA